MRAKRLKVAKARQALRTHDETISGAATDVEAARGALVTAETEEALAEAQAPIGSAPDKQYAEASKHAREKVRKCERRLSGLQLQRDGMLVDLDTARQALSATDAAFREEEKASVEDGWQKFTERYIAEMEIVIARGIAVNHPTVCWKQKSVFLPSWGSANNAFHEVAHWHKNSRMQAIVDEVTRELAANSEELKP